MHNGIHYETVLVVLSYVISVLGSYTGAIGIPQFLPSSIVQYAISYDGNKQIDLRTSQADAIGSVANYLKQNGWENGRPVVWDIGPDAGSQAIQIVPAL